MERGSRVVTVSFTIHPPKYLFRSCHSSSETTFSLYLNDLLLLVDLDRFCCEEETRYELQRAKKGSVTLVDCPRFT